MLVVCALLVAAAAGGEGTVGTAGGKGDVGTAGRKGDVGIAGGKGDLGTAGRKGDVTSAGRKEIAGTATPAFAFQGDPDDTDVKALNILQQEIRKNNDDYKEMTSDGATPRRDTAPSSPNRRALGAELPPAPAPGPAPPPPPPTPAKPKKFSGPAESGAGGAGGASRNPKYVNKRPAAVDRKKVDKLRTFLDKYKVIVNEFMANHSEAPTTPQRQETPAPTRRQDAAELPPRQDGPAPDTRLKEKGKDPSEAPVLRARQGRLPAGLDDRLPTGDQLDMAPARGGAVHTLRNKNRLCHRHVMIPEGPKYDSHGKAYLAEYSPVRENDYTHTRAPKVLLPKCCNCCRKSVLGCE